MTKEEADALMPPVGHVNLFTYPFSKVKEKSDARAIFAGGTFVILALSMIGTIVTPIAALAYGAVTGWRAEDLSAAPFIWAVLGTLVIVSLLSSGFVVWSWANLRRQLKEHDIQKDFKIRQCVNLCIVNSPSEIVYKHRFLVRAKRQGSRILSVSFTFTGDSPLDVRLRDANHKWSLTSSRRGRQILNIDIGRDLAVGNEENVEFDIYTSSVSKDPMPYYGITISAPKFPFLNTYLLVAFDQSLSIASVYREEFFSSMSEHPIRRRVVSPEPAGVRWRVPVGLGRRYCISWTYSST